MCFIIDLKMKKILFIMKEGSDDLYQTLCTEVFRADNKRTVYVCRESNALETLNVTIPLRNQGHISPYTPLIIITCGVDTISVPLRSYLDQCPNVIYATKQTPVVEVLQRVSNFLLVQEKFDDEVVFSSLKSFFLNYLTNDGSSDYKNLMKAAETIDDLAQASKKNSRSAIPRNTSVNDSLSQSDILAQIKATLLDNSEPTSLLQELITAFDEKYQDKKYTTQAFAAKLQAPLNNWLGKACAAGDGRETNADILSKHRSDPISRAIWGFVRFISMLLCGVGLLTEATRFTFSTQTRSHDAVEKLEKTLNIATNSA